MFKASTYLKPQNFKLLNRMNPIRSPDNSSNWSIDLLHRHHDDLFSFLFFLFSSLLFYSFKLPFFIQSLSLSPISYLSFCHRWSHFFHTYSIMSSSRPLRMSCSHNLNRPQNELCRVTVLIVAHSTTKTFNLYKNFNHCWCQTFYLSHFKLNENRLYKCTRCIELIRQWQKENFSFEC